MTEHQHNAQDLQRLPPISSRQVSWWSVHEYVTPRLAAAESWPMAGTPAWCQLDDDDPVKLAALCDAAQHHALRVETAQAALADASKAVSDAEDWSAVATKAMHRHSVYIPRRAS
jgi:Protein of unknown function (DUF2742)